MGYKIFVVNIFFLSQTRSVGHIGSCEIMLEYIIDKNVKGTSVMHIAHLSHTPLTYRLSSLEQILPVCESGVAEV